MTSAADRALRWSPGDHVIYRNVFSGRVWTALPVTVIEDSNALISVYVAPGTKFAFPGCAREQLLAVAASGEWDLVIREWSWQHHVWASVPGEACSVWTMWAHPDWSHLGWKVNPQEPIKRTGIGFDTLDHVLDAVIKADLSSWAWKDEDELAEAIELGLITEEESKEIRRVTLRVATDAVKTGHEQLQRWAAWRPPPGWELPALAGDWEAV